MTTKKFKTTIDDLLDNIDDIYEELEQEFGGDEFRVTIERI